MTHRIIYSHESDIHSSEMHNLYRDCFSMFLLPLGISITLSWVFSVPWFLFLVTCLYHIWTMLHPQHPLLLRQRHLQVAVIPRPSADSEVILWGLDNSVEWQRIQFDLGNQVPSLPNGTKILYLPHIYLNFPTRIKLTSSQNFSPWP